MKKNYTVKIYILAAVLVVALGVVGVNYGFWQSDLHVHSELDIGTMSIIFDDNDSLSLSIVDFDGRPAGETLGAGDIECSVDADKKRASLLVTEELLLTEISKNDRMLALTYTIRPDDDSVIRSITPYEADFSIASTELLEFSPREVALTVNGVSYEVPDDILEKIAPTLHWEVYREIRSEGETITGTTYFKLDAESMEKLQNSDNLDIEVGELSDELRALAEAAEGGTRRELMVKAGIKYSFEFPIVAEQSH